MIDTLLTGSGLLAAGSLRVGKRADAIMQYVRKGDQIAVCGSFNSRKDQQGRTWWTLRAAHSPRVARCCATCAAGSGSCRRCWRWRRST